MKIVIDIPEEMYTNGQLDKFFGCSSKKLDEVIYTGTLLPKGHGCLIDQDDLIGKIHGVRSIAAVLDAPVIIKADGGDAE